MGVVRLDAAYVPELPSTIVTDTQVVGGLVLRDARNRAERRGEEVGGSARRGRRLVRHSSRDHDESRTRRHRTHTANAFYTYVVQHTVRLFCAHTRWSRWLASVEIGSSFARGNSMQRFVRRFTISLGVQPMNVPRDHRFCRAITPGPAMRVGLR